MYITLLCYITYLWYICDPCYIHNRVCLQWHQKVSPQIVLLYKPHRQLNLYKILFFDDNGFVCKRYVINCYVYNTRSTHPKIVMYITPFVFYMTYICCDPCYIHNSVITIAAKGMSTNCYVYISILTCSIFCVVIFVTRVWKM